MLELFIIVILEASAYFHSIYKFPYNQRFIFIYIINQLIFFIFLQKTFNLQILVPQKQQPTRCKTLRQSRTPSSQQPFNTFFGQQMFTRFQD